MLLSPLARRTGGADRPAVDVAASERQLVHHLMLDPDHVAPDRRSGGPRTSAILPSALSRATPPEPAAADDDFWCAIRRLRHLAPSPPSPTAHASTHAATHLRHDHARRRVDTGGTSDRRRLAPPRTTMRYDRAARTRPAPIPTTCWRAYMASAPGPALPMSVREGRPTAGTAPVGCTSTAHFGRPKHDGLSPGLRLTFGRPRRWFPASSSYV
jgi:hypothetical protein